MTQRLPKALTAVALAIFIQACSSDFGFSSNLDPATINDYFKASDVTLFDNGAAPQGNYKVLGLVEGEACQVSPADVPVTLADARTDARRKAADKGANGLVIKNCTLIQEPDSGCHSRSLCVGEAIRLANE